MADRVDLDATTARAVVRAVVSLYPARRSRNLSLEKFLGYVCDAFAASDSDRKPEGKQWDVFRDRVAALLSLGGPVSITSKAVDVLLQHEHTFCAGRIMTDWRPVFSDGPAPEPEAGFVVHTLKLHYHAGDQMEDFYVAVDHGDLIDIKSQIDRAIAKADSLRQLMFRTRQVDLGPDPETEDA